MKKLFEEYKPIISYLFFGVCTTLINWGSYYVCFNLAGISNVVSTIIAWICAVAFAFITNKLWVFDSKTFEKNILLRELSTFVTARLATGVIDVAIMYFAVDVFSMNSTIWKLISNVIVTILNYFLSKLVIFKNNNSNKK